MAAFAGFNVVVTQPPLLTTSDTELREAEVALATTFPRGYREFVLEFGAVAIGNDGASLQILLPQRIVVREAHFAELGVYGFWKDPKSALSQSQVNECLWLGWDINGNEYGFQRSEPDRIYWFPRHEDRIREAGRSIEETIRWVFKSDFVWNPLQGDELQAVPVRESY